MEKYKYMDIKSDPVYKGFKNDMLDFVWNLPNNSSFLKDAGLKKKELLQITVSSVLSGINIYIENSHNHVEEKILSIKNSEGKEIEDKDKARIMENLKSVITPSMFKDKTKKFDGHEDEYLLLHKINEDIGKEIYDIADAMPIIKKATLKELMDAFKHYDEDISAREEELMESPKFRYLSEKYRLSNE